MSNINEHNVEKKEACMWRFPAEIVSDHKKMLLLVFGGFLPRSRGEEGPGEAQRSAVLGAGSAK